ncbi:MAG: RagB/SusD family nutrient uptake outer membrane protein [Gemmatimonadetes bacterium]|nr:RagB/SusD family nutrient uptake outer membrane protein [Gemmatimonadota bacterium]
MKYPIGDTDMIRAATLAALLMLPLASACKTLDEPDYFAGSLNALEGSDIPPTTINTAAQAMPILTRGVMSGIVTTWGEVGREGHNLDPTNPDGTAQRLVTENRAIGSGTWSNAYQSMRQGNVVLGAVDRAAPGMTDAQKEGIRGWVKTHQAIALLIATNIFDQAGVAIDVNVKVDDPLPAIVTKAAAFARILQLLDEARTHLLAAGSSFSFIPSAGFAGFNTPAGLLKVNRGIRARVNVYLGNWTAALTDLAASFIDTTAALSLGAYNTYSSLSGDITNPLFDPVPRTQVVSPFWLAGAQLRADGTPDLRSTQKTALITTRVLNNITVDHKWNIYKSAADPFPIIKNEELILLRAEANLQAGNRADALKDINVVRVKSGGLAPLASDPGAGGTLTGDLLIDEILYNRRYSLVWEGGHTWIDWRRYGQLAKLPRARTGDVVFPYAPLPDAECIPRDPDPAGCTIPTPL